MLTSFRMVCVMFGMNASISLQAVLAQSIIVFVSAQIVLIIEDLLTGIAQIKKGVWDLVKDELHDHRSRQHAVPQRIELKEVTLTESQKLVSLV